MANKISNFLKQVTDLKKRKEELDKKEKNLDNKEKALQKKEDFLNNKEKALQKKEEENLNEDEKINRRTKVLNMLPSFKRSIVLKQILLLFLPITVCVGGVWLLLSSTKILHYIKNILENKSVVALVVFIFCVMFAIALLLYLVYLIVKRFRRNQNAIQKLNILKLRLDLYIDKDLVALYRLDRELEIIYRILES